MVAGTGTESSHIAGELPPGITLLGDGRRPEGRVILGGVNGLFSRIQRTENRDDKRRGPTVGTGLDTAGTRPYDIAKKGMFSSPA